MEATATKPFVKPSLKEVNEVTPTQNFDTKMWRDVEESLEKAGVPKETPGLGVPPREQVVLSPQLAKTVGAVNVGNEDSDVGANVEHAFKIGKSMVTGESIWARLGKAIRSLNILNKRIKGKEQTLKTTDKSQMDVGE